MKAVITVIGKDMVGILAKVSANCADKNINVLEVTQSILQDLFVMVMLVDISGSSIPFSDFAETLDTMGQEIGVKIHTMHEDIFQAMHRI